MSELIAMQKDLGLGHKGDILLTTQERFDSNREAIAKDIIDKDYAEKIIHRYNAFEDGGLVEELRTALENALTTLAIISMPRQDDNVATDTELLKILGDSFRAALAKI